MVNKKPPCLFFILRHNDIMDDKEKNWLLHEKYEGNETAEYRADLVRLNAGEPLAYIIGNMPFLDCTINLSSRPLIPRTETEFWVGEVIENSCEDRPSLKVLDIFAGSGCIGLALLKHLPNAQVDFAEKNSSHITQIKENITANNIEANRANYFASDMFEDIPQKEYDYIFANPPYISTEDIGAVQESVLAWESPEALFAEDGGLSLIKKLIQTSRAYLSPAGALLIEFNTPQKDALGSFLAKENIHNFSFHKDQYSAWRMLELNFS